MGDYLYWAVVVAELFLGDYIGVVAVYVAVDADNVAHNTRYCANIVRHHNDGHILVQVAKKHIQLILEAVVNKVGRLVEN